MQEKEDLTLKSVQETLAKIPKSTAYNALLETMGILLEERKHLLGNLEAAQASGTQLRERARTLEAALKDSVDDVIWMSGGMDLGPGQPGHEHWKSDVNPRILKHTELLKTLRPSAPR